MEKEKNSEGEINLLEWVCQPQSRRFSGGSRLANIDDFPNQQNSLSFMAENFNTPASYGGAGGSSSFW